MCHYACGHTSSALLMEPKFSRRAGPGGYSVQEKMPGDMLHVCLGPPQFACYVQWVVPGTQHFPRCFHSCVYSVGFLPSGILFVATFVHSQDPAPSGVLAGPRSLFGKLSTVISSSCRASCGKTGCLQCRRRLLALPSLSCRSMPAGRRWIVLDPAQRQCRAYKPASLVTPLPTRRTILACPCRSQKKPVHGDFQLQCWGDYGNWFTNVTAMTTRLGAGLGLPVTPPRVACTGFLCRGAGLPCLQARIRADRVAASVDLGCLPPPMTQP